MAIYTIEQFRADMLKAHAEYVAQVSAATDGYMRSTAVLMDRSRQLDPSEVLPVVEAVKGLFGKTKAVQ